MNKLLVVCGPTATGKTSLGIRLAKKLNGEIISADSRQVYQGMDIGTGKDKPQKVKIHLTDVVAPNQEFSLAHFYRLAWRELKNLWQRGKLPILVGGTGLYLKGVVDGIETTEIPRQPQLRAKLEGWSAEKLFDYLAQIDFEKAGLLNQSDRKNPRRLVRAIEIALYRQENPFWQPSEHQSSDALFVGLTAPMAVLDKKVEARVKARLKQGLEAEIRGLLAKGFTWKKSALGDTLGYQEWQPFFEGQATWKEVINHWLTHESQYARRQMTWFRKNKRIHWFDISRKGWQNEIEELVNQWFSKKDGQ
jgi:tRNA dimethylallyltransferase